MSAASWTSDAADRPADLDGLCQRWLAAVQEQQDESLALRRRLHAEPRLSGDEEEAAALLEEAIGIPLSRIAGTGRIGRLGPSAGPGVLLRAELDALPVTEETGVGYAAANGAMHACGHDVHQAALVAVVRAARDIDLPLGLVPFLQPREETYPSGAQDAVESGLLDGHGVAVAIGAHVHPGVPRRAVATGAGVVNAAADEIEVVLHGHGGHGAYPHHAADPVAALAHVALALPELVRRTVSPMRPSTISVGHLQAGGPSANVLPSRARLLAILRTTDPADRGLVQERLLRLVDHQAQAFGLRAEVTVTAGEPVLSNDLDLVDRMDAWLARCGVEPVEPMRSLGSDDFAFLGEQVPSVMSFVGVDVEGDDEPPLHHPAFLPTEESVLDVATALVSGYLAAVELLR